MWGVLYSSFVSAEFLDLPEVKEMEESRRETYLKDLDVPGVQERSPDPSAGPRLAVSEFRIQGLVEYPQLGITREALNQLVESIRFEIMGEGKLLESGYTIDELGQISDLLVEIEDESLDRHVSELDLQKLVWLVREQRGKRGVTLGQIEAVASKITNFYRERGFILAKAYIPKQQVRDGIVNLTLLLGHLGEVKVVNNSLYSSEKIQSAFSDLIDFPMTTAAVEERLYLINDYPGLVVDGYFEPGYQVGDTRLNINVKSERKFDASVRVDNHGSDDTGLYRLYGEIQSNNLLGVADAMSAAVLRASSPSNTTYWRFKYDSDVFTPRIKAGLEFSKNQFLVDKSSSPASLEITGDVEVKGVHAKYIFSRGRALNASLDLRAEQIHSDLQLGDAPDLDDSLDEELTNYSASYDFDVLQESKQRLHQGRIKLTSGGFDFGADSEQDENYALLNTDYTLLMFWKIPFTDSSSRVIARANLQYAGKNLSPIMRFSLAGPTRARAYQPNLFTADDGAYMGIDWIFNSPDWFDFGVGGGVNFKDIARPFVFADVAYGRQYTLTTVDPDGNGRVFDAGIGLQVAYGNHVQGNLMFALPVSEKFEATNTPTIDNYRVVFDFQYTF